ncbi:MAG: D-alanine--poly(phosphoribitol) ligase subunit DltA [Desulfitobacterium hafniense]|nr:D-alanine--poly(phosphoribitol) ligase subunit DltA [Desulfitobacterium hafniense]
MLREKIDAWAIECADRIAHKHRQRALTYKGLKEESDALAIWIYETYMIEGIKRQTPVIVYGHKENEMLVSFVASIKSGNPYVPVDSSVPVERFKQIIQASGARLILSPKTVPDEIKELTDLNLIIKDNISLFDVLDFYSRYIGQVPPTEWQVGLDEVYYIIYTSGSTGVPKGVQITLRALESYLNWVNTAYQPVEKSEVYLNQAPFSFDLSVMDLYMSLSTGGTLWSVDKEQIANPRELFESFKESEVSIWVSTPSFAEVCLMDKSFNQELLPNLKRFLFCGEVLTHDCASKLVQRFPKGLVENLYGPTEATVAVTTVTITPEIHDKYNPLPVGAAKPDCKVLICNSEALTEYTKSGDLTKKPEILPEEERGEIIIAGPNVSIGYLNNPEQTAKAFFTWEENGEKLQAYRTGDAGMWKEGQLFFFGRLDFQVKLHGYRIELGDIEENLRQIDWIDNAVVLPIERKGKVDYLHAFLTANKDITSEFEEAQAVREALRSSLPDYMIPRRISFLERMPMTPNGKVDRRALLGGQK